MTLALTMAVTAVRSNPVMPSAAFPEVLFAGIHILASRACFSIWQTAPGRTSASTHDCHCDSYRSFRLPAEVGSRHLLLAGAPLRDRVRGGPAVDAGESPWCFPQPTDPPTTRRHR